MLQQHKPSERASLSQYLPRMLPHRPAQEPQSNNTGTSTPFKNCTEARNAGVAPVLRGEPGYGTHLDRDGDGVG